MGIDIGSKLGPYEIESSLGAGGMGEVYKARDTRLDRTVAIKVLPAHLNEHPDAKQRLEREARAISNLSHPNICTLHDIGSQDGVDFLVMEYIDGETLTDRLAKGALTFEKALEVAIQVADGLDKAHRLGVVHRDFKPGNIMLTRTGAKLLDFGLAKLAAEAGPGPSSESFLPTQQMNLTKEGTILGTVQYMSPEQLEGRDVDYRSDIFAFGAVLYEMLTGKKAFEANTHASAIAGIMTRQPPSISSHVKALPHALDRVIKKCLAKDPDERWQSAHDLGDELRWLLAEPSADEDTRRPSRHRPGIERAVLALAALVLLGSFVLYFARRTPPPTSAGIVRFPLLPPEGTSADPRWAYAAVSPTGEHIAFRAMQKGQLALALKSMGELEAKILPGTEEARSPFWAPDGRSLAYQVSTSLRAIDVDGGASREICEADTFYGGSWNREGIIVFSGEGNRIYQVPAGGGRPVPVTELDSVRGEEGHYGPEFLSDGRRFLYVVESRDQHEIFLGSLDSTAATAVVSVQEPSYSYVSAGYLLLRHEGALHAQKFDEGSGRVVEEPVMLILAAGSHPISATDDVLVHGSGDAPLTAQLTWYDRNGRSMETIGEVGRYTQMSLSPKDDFVVVQRLDADVGSDDLWIVDLTREGVQSRLTSHPAFDTNPVWYPDGSRVLFSSPRDVTRDLFGIGLSGNEEASPVMTSPFHLFPEDISRDGTRLAFFYGVQSERPGIWVASLDEGEEPLQVVKSSFRVDEAKFSPNGKWIAYVSDEAGQFEVYVQPLEGSGSKFRISSGGGGQPIWRADGEELFYLAADGNLMTVSMDWSGEGGLRPGIPEPLFQTGLDFDAVRDQYAPTQDGQRFLVLTRAGERRALTVVVNWRKLLEE